MESAATSTTTFADIHPHIILSHILPRVDAPSLSVASTASSYLQTLCADQNLWRDICNSIWPSTTHPRVHDVISTFPTGYLSFFQDSSPPPTPRRSLHPSTHPWPSELLSLVDIRYKGDVIYSVVEFTDTKGDFMSSKLRIVIKNDPASNCSSIDLKVEELVNADDPLIAHLKESLTLTWIVINPIQKRAMNLSSMKAVLVWVGGDITLRFATVLGGGGCEMVECRIELALGMEVGVGLQVKKMKAQLYTVEKGKEVSGREFLEILRDAVMDGNGRRDKVSENGTMERMIMEDERRRRCVINGNSKDVIMQVASFVLCIYFTMILLF